MRRGLEHVALVAELDGKIEILEATSRLGSSVGLDLDDALKTVTQQAAHALSCERAAVYLTDPTTGEVSLGHVFARDASPAQLLAEDEGLDWPWRSSAPARTCCSRTSLPARSRLGRGTPMRAASR